jgi:hypothetical protein
MILLTVIMGREQDYFFYTLAHKSSHLIAGQATNKKAMSCCTVCVIQQDMAKRILIYFPTTS